MGQCIPKRPGAEDEDWRWGAIYMIVWRGMLIICERGGNVAQWNLSRPNAFVALYLLVLVESLRKASVLFGEIGTNSRSRRNNIRCRHISDCWELPQHSVMFAFRGNFQYHFGDIKWQEFNCLALHSKQRRQLTATNKIWRMRRGG